MGDALQHFCGLMAILNFYTKNSSPRCHSKILLLRL